MSRRSVDDLRRGFAEADAVICTLGVTVDGSLLAHATRLKSSPTMPSATQH